LLDVNNVYVSCFNSDQDPINYLHEFPFESVVQMHLAGHQNCGTHIIDTHDSEVLPAVWELFRMAWQRTGGVSTLLEWDGNIPPFQECHKEVLKAKEFMQGELILDNFKAKATDAYESVSNPLDFIVPKVMNNTQINNNE
jgi:uncharacterized protein (UPF0276 family)